MPEAGPERNLGWSALVGMGAVAAAQLLAGFGLGWLIDHFAGTTPIFLLIGLLLGIAGAISYTVVEFRRYL
jgi:F0F1-type ATP synthase assembly protein I